MARQQNSRRAAHQFWLLLLIAAANCASALTCPRSSGSPGRELVCHTSSYDPERLESAICHCTALVHLGHDLRSLDASDLSSLRATAKKANRRIRVILSVNDEHQLLKKSANIPDIVGSLIKTMEEVDGLELNVTAGSKQRLVSFLRALKDEMANKDLEKMILLVLPTKPEDLAKKFELKELSKYVDLFTIPTHYLRDSDEANRTFHPSRLMGLFDMLNTDSLVDLVHGMGAPKQKILISAPVNAYHFKLQDPANNIPRSHTLEEEPESYDRQKLCDVMSKGEWTVERDEDLTAPYAFKNTTWIAFEDETSLKIKGKYVILRELAGLALRDVESDRKNTCGIPLVESVHQALTEMKRKPRDAVFSSLEKDLKGSLSRYPRQVRSSDFRIVRVVDIDGNVQAVRENTQTAFTCSRQGYFTHPKSCNRFYRCVKFNQAVDDYSVFEFDCPAGLAFDEKTEICAWPGSLSKGSACPGSSEIEPVPRTRFRCPSHPGFYADPHNCRWFFACYDLGGPEMIPYEFRCPFGLVFDQSKLVCEWPWKVPGCNGPGHGDGSYTQNFGGFSQQEGIPQGGIVGLGGFAGQNGYAGQSPDGLGAYDGPQHAYNYDYSDNQGGSVNFAQNSGFGPNNQNYNPSGGFVDTYNYNGQPQAVAGNSDAYPGQPLQNFAGIPTSQGGQNFYNPGNSGSSYTPFVFYNNDDEPAKNYNGQSGSYPTGNSGYDGQKYNDPTSSGTYNGQNFAGPGSQYPTYYDQQPVYPGKNNQNAPAPENQDFNNNRVPANNGANAFDNTAAKGSGNSAKDNYDATSFTTGAVDYDDQRGTSLNFGVTGQTSVYANNGAQTPQTNSGKYGTTVGVDNYAGTTQAPAKFNTNAPNSFKTTNSAADYFDSQRVNGATTPYGGPGKDKGSDYAAGTTNYAGNSAATYQTNGVGVTTGNNFIGIANAKQSSVQYMQANEIFGPGPAGSRYPSYNVDYSQTNQKQNSGFNSFESSLQSGNSAAQYTQNFGLGQNSIGNKVPNNGAPLITPSNSINSQSTGFSTTGNSESSGKGGPYTYNSTYYAAAGYPTSSILPFVTTPNSIHTADYNGAPIINSVIYRAQVEMGLSSSEYFGNEYPNQAEKSFLSQGYNQNLAAFPPARKNDSNYDFHRGTPVVENLSANLAGIVPANKAAPIAPSSKLNSDSVQTEVYGNSEVFGQTTVGFSNEVTKFSQTTKSPQSFGLSGTTSADDSFRTNYASGSQYNQGTTLSGNAYADFGRVTTPGPSVTPGKFNQNYNTGDSTVPGVLPLNKQKTSGPNDFGSYQTNYAGFTTSSYTKSADDYGYKTNEYHDNGGRGTIRYNNGVVTSKVTQGYNTSPFTDRPESPNRNNFNRENTQSPVEDQKNNDLQQFTEGVYTKGGFTKTGPTKTGITTAQVGGSGSYIIGTGLPRQKPDPAFIGEHAFKGSPGTSKPGFNSDIVRTTPTSFADVTGTSYVAGEGGENYGVSKSPNNYNNAGSPYNPARANEKYATTGYSQNNAKLDDRDKFKGYSYPGPTPQNDKSKGYSYPKPLVQVETDEYSNSKSELSQTKYFDATTPSSFSANQPSKYEDDYGTTVRPLAFTTDQAENFRTTVYQAAKIHQATSTLKPVVDNGYKSVILSTPVPAVISTQSYQSDEITTREKTYLDVGVTFGQNDYYNNQDSSDYSDTFTTSDQGNFGQKIATQSNFAQTQYYQTTQNPQVFNQNNELRPFAQKNNYPAPNKASNVAQPETKQEKQPFSPNTVVPLPKQVYVNSNLVTPAVGVTYGNPIVAANFRQRQPNQPTSSSLSPITDLPVSVQRGSNYRILQQRPASEVATNQVHSDFRSQAEFSGGSRGQAPTGFVPQAYSETFYGNQGQTDINRQRYNNVRVNNQSPMSYVHQTSNAEYSGPRYGQNSALHRVQDGTSGSFYNQNSGNSVSAQGQGFSGQTRTLIGSNVITSIGSFNSDTNGQNAANEGELRILTEFNNANSKKYQQSTTSTPEITTFGGQYGSSQIRTKSNDASSSRDEDKRVVVKLSDLHPLILGKLNAECTCKADPFAVLRGPNKQSLPINSQNRGRVDLANYDVSDIYVDVDDNQRNRAEIEFVKNLPPNQVLSSSRLQLKAGSGDRSVLAKNPAPGYLPAAAPSNEYLPSSTQPSFTPIYENEPGLNAHPRSLFVKVDNIGSASYTRSRNAKALVSGDSVNNVRTQNGVVRELRTREDTLGLECARPGLFRHPKQCNKFYACHWDEWKRRYTLHVFNCPVHLAFDANAGACNFPSKGPACQDNKLLL